MKTAIKVTKENFDGLKTSDYKFYLVGCPRPLTKTNVKEGLELGAMVTAVSKKKVKTNE